MQYTLRNLQEATEYSITVSGVLSDGEDRNHLTVSTLAAGQHLLVCNIVKKSFTSSVLHAFHVVPSGPPISVNVSLVTASTITVQWERMDCIHHNGHLTGYSVRYGVQGYHSTQTMNVLGGSVATATISNLSVSTTYEIEVAAVNSTGSGIFSPVVIAVTRQSECFMAFITCMHFTIVHFGENNTYGPVGWCTTHLL